MDRNRIEMIQARAETEGLLTNGVQKKSVLSVRAATMEAVTGQGGRKQVEGEIQVIRN